MARVKRGVTSGRKHKKLLRMAKGYRGARKRSVKRARESVLHSGEYAFAGRKDKKGALRRLFITRINSATRNLGVSYKDFMTGLAKKKIALNRKILADLAVSDFNTFKKVVEEATSQNP